MSYRKYEKGVFEPKKTPKRRNTWVPVEPVHYGRPENWAGQKGWAWLFKCEKCGEERTMWLYSGPVKCECQKVKNKPPKPVKVECSSCGEVFEKDKKQAQRDEWHYCCDICESIGHGPPTDEWTAMTRRGVENWKPATPNTKYDDMYTKDKEAGSGSASQYI